MQRRLPEVGSSQVGDVEMKEEQQVQTPETRPPETTSNHDATGKPLTACNLLSDMYYKQRSLDPDNVSIQSAFICILHLANENDLRFEQPDAFMGDAVA